MRSRRIDVVGKTMVFIAVFVVTMMQMTTVGAIPTASLTFTSSSAVTGSSMSVSGVAATKIKYSVGSLTLTDPTFTTTKTATEILNELANVDPVITEVGNQEIVSRVFNYYVDVIAYTDIPLAKTTKTFDIGSISVARDPGHPTALPANTIAFVEDRAPSNRWWSKVLDRQLDGVSGTLSMVNGYPGQLPVSGRFSWTSCDGSVWFGSTQAWDIFGWKHCTGTDGLSVGFCGGDYISTWRNPDFDYRTYPAQTQLDTTTMMTNSQAGLTSTVTIPMNIKFDAAITGNWQETLQNTNILKRTYVDSYSTLASVGYEVLYSGVSSGAPITLPGAVTQTQNTITTGTYTATARDDGDSTDKTAVATVSATVESISSTTTAIAAVTAVTSNPSPTQVTTISGIQTSGDKFTITPTISLRPRTDISKRTITAAGAYRGFYDPSTDLLGNLYYPNSADVTGTNTKTGDVDTTMTINNVAVKVRVKMSVRSVSVWTVSEITTIPVGVTPTLTKNQRTIDLQWNGIQNSQGYYVYRSSTSTLPGQVHATVLNSGQTTVTWSETVPTDGTYNYWVKVFNQAGFSPVSQMVTAIVDELPSVPSLNVISSPSGTGIIQLQWTAGTKASSYLLYRATSTITNLTMPGLTSIPVTGTSYTDTLTTESTYYYTVISKNTFGTSVMSQVRSVIVDFNDLPATPSLNVISSPSSTGIISLQWSAAAYASSYVLYRNNVSITNLTMSGLTLFVVDGTSYTDSIIIEDIYYYVVIGQNSFGTSGLSDVQSVTVDFPSVPPPYTPQPSYPDAPTVSVIEGTYPTSTNILYKNVVLSWTIPANADGYKVYRATQPFTTPSQATLIKTTTAITYTSVEFTNGLFYYGVVAYNGTGDGALSNRVTFLVDIAPARQVNDTYVPPAPYHTPYVSPLTEPSALQTPTVTEPTEPTDDSTLIVIGIVVSIAIVAVVVFLMYRMRSKPKQSK